MCDPITGSNNSRKCEPEVNDRFAVIKGCRREYGSRDEGSRMSSTLARRLRRAGLAALVAFALASVSTSTVPASAGAGADPLAAVPVKRACPEPARAGQVTCLALVRTDVRPQYGIQPQSKPAGLGALDLRSAYNLPTS